MKIRLFIGFLLIIRVASAQSHIIDSLKFQSTITAFSQDRSGNIFIAKTGGDITKYSPDFDSLLTYSPARRSNIKLLEAWHGFQIFAFNEDFQDYTILDRYLTQPNTYILSPQAADYIDICTLSRDLGLWAIEENNLRLIKLNRTINKVEIDTSLEFIIDSQNHHISFIKEYQNLLFVVDSNTGIYVFDNLGNFLRKIEASGISSCWLDKDQLYYISENYMFVQQLYKVAVEKYSLPPAQYLGVLSQPSGFILIEPNGLLRYRIDDH